MPDTTTNDQTDFAVTLLDLDSGRVHDDATRLLARLVEAVGHTAAAGTLTLTVKVEPLDPATFQETGLLTLTGKITVKEPLPNRAPALFWSTGVDGQLSRQDTKGRDLRAIVD